jgi:uncharacterized membrane protein YccC
MTTAAAAVSWPLNRIEVALSRLPAFGINGIAVSASLGLVIAVVALVAGTTPALLASGGAIYAIQADRPTTPRRAWRRLALTGGAGCLTALIAGLLRPHPYALGVAVCLIGFLASMALAWGPRAGPQSFVPVLALVFTMAGPVPETPAMVLTVVGFNLLGAVLYSGLAMMVTVLMQRRYRTLAVAAVLGATAALLRIRAGLIRGGDDVETQPARLSESIRADATVAETLQIARDFLFDAMPSERTDRLTAMLLRLIDLRDRLLASRLDVELLGVDEIGKQARGHLSANLLKMAAALDQVREALLLGHRTAPWVDPSADLDALVTQVKVPDDDARALLVPMLAARTLQMVEDIVELPRLLEGTAAEMPLPRDELKYFVTPEAWPLAALRQALTWRSPVLRHAVRLSLALTTAYYLGLSLPWASHPHWLVLSVAVVLRGNLEQTIARRKGRVIGTILGCLAVTLLAHLHQEPLVVLVFVVAAGVAHTFFQILYTLTAAAASVMALLQPHLVDPGSGLAVAERIADTLIGATLASLFAYLLPSWERETLPRTIARVLRGLGAYAQQMLQWPAGPEHELKQRQARREAYDALTALAGVAQRTAVEPRRVRLPLQDVANMLTVGYRMLAHLALVKSSLVRRGADLDRAEVEGWLKATALAVERGLHSYSQPAPAQEDVDLEPGPSLPLVPAAEDVAPWLKRRLASATRDGRQAAQVARTLLARAGERKSSLPA